MPHDLLKKLGIIWVFYFSTTAIVVTMAYINGNPIVALIMLIPFIINLGITVLLIHDRKKIETSIRAAIEMVSHSNGTG